MIRWFDAALVMMIVMAASITFWIKHDSRRIAAEIEALERRVAGERTAIELQRAEWSLLTQPDRLQALTEAHGEQLGLEPIDADQFVTLEELEAVLDDVAPSSIEAVLGVEETDDTATGSVR